VIARHYSIFRVDTGPKVGLGHIVRCTAIANCLADFGIRSGFVLGPSKLADFEIQLLGSHDVFHLPADSELHAIGRFMLPDTPILLVVDHYHDGRSNLESQVFRNTKKVLIDDLASHTDLPCDVLINPNTGSDLTTTHSYQRLLGPKYAPIRDEIRELAGQWHPTLKQGQRDQCVISIGATDPLNLTCSILQTIARCPEREDFKFTVVLSSFAPHLAAVKALCTALASEILVELIEDAVDMGALYRDAHCCIGAAGSSAWERCCVGLPTAQLVVAKNQRHIHDTLLSAGAVFDLPNPDDNRFLNALRNFLRSANARDQSFLTLSKRGQELVDGAGAQRIAQALTQGLS
jgi:UDP-2,4-diacetamido-2,4,6-trideoxy-beta-L-altropyranose hydrolase